VMPADGRMLVFARITEARFTIKGNQIHLAELLGDPGETERYLEGTAIVVRLAPCDYHRFHFPDAGQASETCRIRGRLHSVHPIALRGRAPSFRNLRHVTQLDSDNFGRVTLVEIGAFAVGSIIQTYSPGPVSRGQEKGYFRFGGSTVVAVVPANRLVLDDDLVNASESGVETFVKMGTSIGSALYPQAASARANSVT
jgi:phosphatidylserine decarboxylase